MKGSARRSEIAYNEPQRGSVNLQMGWDERPIGVFDSGLGGLTVVRAP